MIRTLEPMLIYFHTIVPDLRLLRTLLIALLRLVFDAFKDYFEYSTQFHASNVYELLINTHTLHLRHKLTHVSFPGRFYALYE
jgi:hypothetical protein